MALNLDKFLKLRQFRLQTESLGELICHNFSLSVMSNVENWFDNSKNSQPDQFARYLATLICQPIIEKKNKNYRIDNDLAELLKPSEIEEFSKLIIEKNQHFLHDQEKQETVKTKNDNDKITVSIKNCVADELLKKSEESHSEHLLRVMKIYLKQYSIKSRALFDNVNKNLFSTSTIDLIKENKRISESLGTTIMDRRPHEIFKFPENPVFETNRQLASFGQEVNSVAKLIKNMNDLGVQMAIDSTDSTSRTKFWNNIMFILGLITLVVSAFFSYLSFSSSNSSTVRADRLLQTQNILLEEQNKSLLKLVDSISAFPSFIEQEITQGEDEEKILQEISLEAKRISSKPDFDPSTVKSAKDGLLDR